MKKIFSVFFLLAFFSCMIAWGSPETAAASDVSYSKKIVSVVYDDSGSMLSDERYIYANYAMQTFCGLLGAEDELYITYMNKYQTVPQKINLSDSSIQSSVNGIRNEATASGGTPYDSVVAAMNLLRSKQDSNEKTEYCLFVITDGAFSNLPSNSDSNSISSFADERMYNGTKPQIIYLGIGAGVPSLGVSKSNVKEFHAVDNSSGASNKDGVVAKMSEIANLISGRSQVSASKVTAVNDRTLEISSDVPLSNIAVLVQGSNGQVVSITHKESGKSLTVGRNVSSYWPNRAALSSQSFLITAGKDNISSGTYVLTFDKAVSKDNVVLMFEPALELRLSITCNGREIDKLSELDRLHERDQISVSYDIYEYGTDNKVLLSNLPQGTTASLSVSENGTLKQTVNGSQNAIHHYSLNMVKTEFKASLQIPNFNPIETYIDFTPLKYVNYTVGAEFGSSTESVRLDNIEKQHGLSILFTLYADGVPVTNPEEVKAFAPKVTLSPEGNDGTTTVRSDGKIVFTPNAAPSEGFVDGSLSVTAVCEVNGVSVSKAYRVTVPVYTVQAEFGSSDESVKLTEIGKQHGLSIIFTVYEDGVRITDKSKLEALGFHHTVSPEGNDGKLEVTADGKIIFTPTAAKPTGASEFDVTVTLEAAGVQTSKTYRVLAPVYTVNAEFASSVESIKLTEIGKQHGLSIVFTVYEDGVLITDKSKLEALGFHHTVSPEGNDGKLEVTADGKIIFTPTA
ncbi:MAG: hypothetical protein IJA86_00010, partial [Clostridia bacterium]|nr:hypothetical protein [Clostridia bacterium]